MGHTAQARHEFAAKRLEHCEEREEFRPVAESDTVERFLGSRDTRFFHQLVKRCARHPRKLCVAQCKVRKMHGARLYPQLGSRGARIVRLRQRVPPDDKLRSTAFDAHRQTEGVPAWRGMTVPVEYAERIVMFVSKLDFS